MTPAPLGRRPHRAARTLAPALLLALVCPLTGAGAAAAAAVQSGPQRWTAAASTAVQRGPLRDAVPVNSCVPKRLHGKAITFKATDGVRLSGLVLGSGPRGVVLSHENGWNICSWLAFAEELAAAGYQVLVYDQRNVYEGASEQGGRAANLHFDRDVRAAVQQLRDRGARHILAGGASMGGTATATVAPEIPELVGLLILSSPRELPVMKPLPGLAKVTVPSFFAAATGDQTFVDEVRALHRASGAKDKRLHILDSPVHGVDMMEDGEAGARLHDQALAFVDDAFRKAGAAPPSDHDRSTPPAGRTDSAPPPTPATSPATRPVTEWQTPKAAAHDSEEPGRSPLLAIGTASAFLVAAVACVVAVRRRGKSARHRR
ncbi:alpha/beta hydrolase [Streptomyces sp. NPDC006339]|uniref:alpha/beta hydrolase n=1 Tax=Streptomyces sp. NPDC006339 TaxID=3156755 RepID=UPI00339F7BE6